MGRTRRILTLIGEHDLLKFPEALRDFKGCWVLKTFAEINFNNKFVKFVRGAYEGKIAKLLYKTKHRITVQFYTKTVLQDERVSVNPKNYVFLLDKTTCRNLPIKSFTRRAPSILFLPSWTAQHTKFLRL